MDWLPQFSYTMLCFIIVGGMASMFIHNSGMKNGEHAVNMDIFMFPYFGVKISLCEYIGFHWSWVHVPIYFFYNKCIS